MRRADAHIVYCEDRMLLDKGPYGDWREVQDTYTDYKASLGPWTEDEIIGFLRDDWGQGDARWLFSRDSIAEFFRSNERVLAKASHNPPMQRTGAAGILSGVRKWLGRGPGR